MCGLAGAILGEKRRTREELRIIAGVFTELVLLNQIRGTHATGVAVVRKDGSFRLLKRPWPAEEFIQDKLYHAVLELDNKVTILLGHTRWKTHGSEQNSLNNHPIHAGRVLGTHNGVITNADELARKLHLPRVAEVDSEVLFRIADRASDAEDFRRLLRHCEGSTAAAFVRLDEPDKLWLLRGDRPLHAAYAPRLRTLFYASEGWMLGQALEAVQREEIPLPPSMLLVSRTSDPAGTVRRLTGSVDSRSQRMLHAQHYLC